MDSRVFIAGATGYMGARLAASLIERGHQVQGLVRGGSLGRLPPGCIPVPGNALDAASYAHAVPAGGTVVHLVGTPHPAPWKGSQFIAVDLKSLIESVKAARQAKARHFVYVSVAHPAPVMASYIRVRSECEDRLAESGLPHTILRPWYVLGPGHRWPVILRPFYQLAERVPALRDGSGRLGLVTLEEMVGALVEAVENPVDERRVVEVREIRKLQIRVQAKVVRA